MKKYFFTFLATLSIFGCTSQEENPKIKITPQNPLHQVDTTLLLEQRLLTRNNNTFAFDTYKKLAEQTPEGNLVFSAFATYETLFSLWASTNGKSKKEIETLIFKDEGEFSNSKILDLYRTCIFQAANTKEFSSSNLLYANSELKLNEALIPELRKHTLLELESVNFPLSSKNLEKINSKVEKKTFGMIKKFLDSSDSNSDTSILLLNVAAFDAKWEKSFSKDKNFTGDFYLKNGNLIKTLFMKSDKGAVVYTANDKFEAAKMFYKNKRYAITFLKPKMDDGLKNFTDMNYLQLSIDLKSEERPASLILPKLKIENQIFLTEALQALGVKSIFEPNTDCKFFEDKFPQYVNKIKAKSVFEFDEEGTKAASAIAISRTLSSVDLEFQLSLDREFLFVISECATDTILFMGRISDPSK